MQTFPSNSERQTSVSSEVSPKSRRRGCRYVRLSQLLGESQAELEQMQESKFRAYLQKITARRSSEPLQIANASGTPCCSSRAIDLLEVFVTFAPELCKHGLKVVVLDRLEAVTADDMGRLISCIKQLFQSRLFVVVMGIDGHPIELSTYREVVCNDDYLEIILRDVLARPTEPAEYSFLTQESAAVSAVHRYSRRGRRALS